MNAIKTTYNFIMLCTKTEIKLRNCVTLQNDYLDLKDVLECNDNTQNTASNICRICLKETTDPCFITNERCCGMVHSIEKMLSICFPSLVSISSFCKKCTTGGIFKDGLTMNQCILGFYSIHITLTWTNMSFFAYRIYLFPKNQ